MDRSIQVHASNAVSATERVPGAAFRAAVGRFVDQNKVMSREALARALRERLAASGVDYHLRTLKRQISGAVATVPPEVLSALRAVVVESVGDANCANDQILGSVAFDMNGAEVLPLYVAQQRVLPLVKLWLYLHPGRSKRALALRLRTELERMDIRLNIDSLQSILAGKQQLVRRELKDVLLAMLRENGIEDAAQAEARWNELSSEIRTSHEGRFFDDARKIHDIAREWKIVHKEPSSRKLALRLRERLAERGVEMGLPHIQKLVDGRAHRVRHGVATVIEDILRHEMTTQPAAAPASASKQANELDLAWVRAEPIAEMARRFVAQNSDMTMRKLSIEISRVVEQFGFATSPNTIQPILGGHKKKTRGFIYRAMLEIDGQAALVPVEHVMGNAARRDRERKTQSPHSDEAPPPSDPQPPSRPRLSRPLERDASLSDEAPPPSDPQPPTPPSPSPRPKLAPIPRPLERGASPAHSAFASYRGAIQRYQALDRATELELALRYRRDGDVAAAHALVESHLQFVVKVASQYRGYGMQLADLVEEGNLGLLEAVRRFEPSRNLRFKTYAVYWIRAFVVEHLLREWSIVGGGKGALVSRTFFRLRRERARLESQLGEHDSSIDAALATRFHTSEETIRKMSQRVGSRDTSLDVAPNADGPTLLDLLADPTSDPEARVASAQRNAFVRSVLDGVLASFDPRERLIVQTRLLADDDEASLGDLGRRLGVSRERVRQLEERTKSKLRSAFEAVTSHSPYSTVEALCA